MLGKTNITAIQESTNVTDIEDYIWKSMKIDGVNSDFVKAVYGNDMLVAITRDGTIVSTADGENWKKTRIETEDAYELEDIIWTGSQYVMVGNRKEIVTETGLGNTGSNNTTTSYKYHGMIVKSKQLTEFSIEEDEDNFYSRYYAVVEKDGSYIIISKEYKKNADGTQDSDGGGVYAVTKNASGSVKTRIAKCTVYQNSECYHFNRCKVIVAKNNGGGAVFVEEQNDSHYGVYKTSDWMAYHGSTMATGTSYEFLAMFECKGYLYYCEAQGNGYYLSKIISTSTVNIICKDIPIFFIDAVYFNKCEIFLTRNSMLVIRTGESIAEKIADELIEITYDFEIKFVEKAFNKLYIFGAGGNILCSSDEAQNNEGIAVKTMSATKALYDAKTYTDEKYAALEARIIELENRS